MTDDPKKRKLEAALASARVTVTLLEAELEQVDALGADGEQMLTTAQTLAEFGIGHDAVKAAAERGELTVSRGARGKLLIERAEIRRYIKSRPLRPRKAAPAANLDDWDAQAERSLRSLNGGRR